MTHGLASSSRPTALMMSERPMCSRIEAAVQPAAPADRGRWRLEWSLARTMLPCSEAAAEPPGRWATTTMRLRLDGRTVAPARAPHGSNGDLVLVEGVVEVAGQLSEVETAQAWDTSGIIRCPGPRKERQDPEALLELGSEDLFMEPVLQPPALLARDVPLRGRSEPNAARLQDDLSSFRIAAASTRRPAATSASESRKAACRAARSASSSQSPGSSGRSSTSVPSGRSVGSSTTRRPAQTRAFRVMNGTLALETSPKQALGCPPTTGPSSPRVRGCRPLNGRPLRSLVVAAR